MRQTTIEKGKRLNTDNVKVGDLMSATYYFSVTNTHPWDESIIVKELNGLGESIRVHGEELINQLHSADQYSEQVKRNKTDLAKRLVESGGKIFTISFEKQNGEERILRGYLLKPETLMGRSHVVDLDKPEDRIRLVDHRHINWIIIDGKKWHK